MDLPTGTVTFLFTDIESSTELWERDEAAARAMLVRHDQIIEELVRDNEGMLVRPRGEGDSRFTRRRLLRLGGQSLRPGAIVGLRRSGAVVAGD